MAVINAKEKKKIPLLSSSGPGCKREIFNEL
jgi:hypothetical protein